MASEKTIEAKLETRTLILIRNAGSTGVTKTQLLQTTRVRTSLLTSVLTQLVHAGILIARQDHGEYSLGRQPVRYWRAELAPPLTVPDLGDIPTLEPGEIAPKGTACDQCGTAIPYVSGRPPKQCSDACRELAARGGIRVADLFAQVKDPLAFGQCATLLVTIDLISRGFRVTPLVYQSGPNLVVFDDESAVLLTVVPISQAGYFPPPEEYNSMAAVYRDGRIKYGGRNPLVIENEGVENTQNVVEALKANEEESKVGDEPQGKSQSASGASGVGKGG
jgi:hypothetical protein